MIIRQKILIARISSFVFVFFLFSAGMVLAADGSDKVDLGLSWRSDERLVGLRFGHLLAREKEGVLSQFSVLRTSNQRARSAHIGSVMAVLATLEEAHVLPPEHDPQANQLIHTLIQMQSAVLKSQNVEFRAWVSKASERKFRDIASSVLASVRDTGLTISFWEAMIDHSEIDPPWERVGVIEGMQEYNVQREDWFLVRGILRQARSQLSSQGESLSEVFARRRLEMPGTGP